MSVCVVIVGKSGVGKTELLKRLKLLGFEKVMTYTTRRRREGEEDRKDYIFLSKGEFMKKVESGEIYEFTEYGGELYGSKIDDYLGGKKCVIVDINGAERLCRDLVDKGCAVLLVVMDGDDEFVWRCLMLRENEDDARYRFYLDKTTFDERKDDLIRFAREKCVDIMYVYMRKEYFGDVSILDRLAESIYWFVEFLECGGDSDGD